MRRLLVALCLLATPLWAAPAFAQARSQLGPLCTIDTTSADQMVNACTKIIALKVFKGEQLATVYFWRAVGWNKKDDYAKVIMDATEAIRLQPSQAVYNLRGSAYYDRGDYDIAIADFDDALKLGASSGIIFHNRGNAWRGRGDYAKAIADYDMAIKADPKSAFSFQNRGISKAALGDLDGALTDINQVEGRNYLIPVDVALKAGSDMTEAMIDMDTIMAGLDGQVRTNILIFDACRNNPMAPQVGSTGTNRGIEGASGLAAPTSLGAGATLGAGMLIAFATAPGQVALDGEGANSPFSAALSRHLGTPGLEVQQMLTRVRAEVVSSTKSKQVPWSNSSLLGEVYLAAK